MIHRYILALALELKANSTEFSDCSIKAVRMGYGCASIMNGSDFDQLCRLIRQLYDVDAGASWTMRVSPADINGANMPFYNRNHISRYDLELFSLEPDDFIHLDYLDYKEQLPYISNGFLRAPSRPVMGFILLYGKKTRSKWGFRRTLLETVRRPVSHVILQKCAGTDLLDEEGCAAEQQEAAQLLGDNGFREYLPGRWAKEGCEDGFWKKADAGTEVLGFGLNAVTEFDGVRSCNTGDLSVYLADSARYDRITVKVD